MSPPACSGRNGLQPILVPRLNGAGTPQRGVPTLAKHTPDGRGGIVLRRSAYPTALEAAIHGSGCSLSRRTGEGQGHFVGNTPPVRHLFLHKPLAGFASTAFPPVTPSAAAPSTSRRERSFAVRAEPTRDPCFGAKTNSVTPSTVRDKR